MSNRLFKRLFEIRLLNGFFLDARFNDAGQAPLRFQDYTSEQQRQALAQYNLQQELRVEPNAATTRKMPGLRQLWRPTPAGLVVGVEVTESGPHQYRPLIDIPSGMEWTFYMYLRNRHWYNFTNYALRPSLPGGFYFTNDPFMQGKNSATRSLATPAPAFSTDRYWEMGELVEWNGGLHQTTRRSNNSADLSPVPQHYWANTSDRIALPKQFQYRFQQVQPVQEAIFELFDAAGNPVKTISATFSQPPVTHLLDFNRLDTPPGAPLPDGPYRLQVTIDGAVAENRRVQLRSDAGGSAAGTPFGIIHIRHHNTADGFELLNPDGTLRYEPDPDNPGRHRPLRFEIRLMPRATWWQYIIEKPDASQLPNIDTDFGQVSFSAVSKTLITNTPRPLTAIRTQLLVDTDHALPNPGVETLQIDTSNERYISQFFLPTIKLT